MDESVLQILTSSPGSAEQQAKTINYFDLLKNSETGWQLCVQTLSSKLYSNEEVQFFCFQVIEHFVKTRYLSSSLEHQVVLRDFLCSWSRLQTAAPSTYLRNKVAQIIALICVQDYPGRWKSFFVDLLSTLDCGSLAVDQFLRVLIAIDTEIADRDIPRTNLELQRNGIIKDTIRADEIFSLLDVWERILTTYGTQSPIVTRLCLQVIGKYIQWIDVYFVANHRFLPVLVHLLTQDSFREYAADCIHDIICKGMDPSNKIDLVQNFSIFLTNAGIWQAFSDGSDPDYLAKLGKILNAMGRTLLESHSKLVKIKKTPIRPTEGLVEEYIDSKIPLMLDILNHDYDDVSSSVLDFLRDYLHLLKNEPVMTENQRKYFQRTLEVVTRKLRYDDEYNFEKEGADEADFLEFRKLLKVVFDNLAQVNRTQVIAHVQNVVEIAVLNWRKLSFEDVEVAFLLLYYLGETVPTSAASLFSLDLEKSSPIQIILYKVMNSDVHLHTHPCVIIQYYETVVRYEKFFVCHYNYIRPVLSNFLKDNGLFHPNKKVRSRTAYLFCRFVKCIRSHITMQLANDIIQAIQPLLALFTPSKTSNEPLMTEDDQLYLYEVVGVSVISGDRSNEKTELMKKVVNPLLDSCRVVTDQLIVEKNSERLVDLVSVIVQAISVTGRLSKAFSNQHTMKLFGCTTIFLDALQVFLHSIEVSSGDHQLVLQSAVRQYLHRMVVCLEEELLPYIPVASQALLKNCDSKSIQEYIPLINQVIAKFKKEVVPFLKQIFAPMVQSIFKTLAEPVESNDQIALRERQLLQRQYFYFIAAIVTNNVNEILSAEENAHVLQQVMLSVIQGSVDFPDPVAQKACFSIMKNFVEMWAGPNSPEGFIDFMYKNILPACFMAPCKPHFDINDAQTLLALNEIGNCLKAIYDKRREEFIVYLQTHYLPTLDLPPAKIQEFTHALQASSKDFRLYLKVFFRQANES